MRVIPSAARDLACGAWDLVSDSRSLLALLVGTTAAAQTGPPVRKISTASALSTEQLGSIVNVRELPDGRVLVNDGTRRRLLLMDTTLHVVDVVLDSLTEVSNAYGVRQGALIPYRGDSTLFVDPASYAALVLDPSARLARVRSVPRVRDAQYLTQPGSFGWPGIDAKGRLIYRMYAEAGPPAVAPPKGVPWFPQDPDSAFIVAMDLDTRKLDTLGSIRTPKQLFIVRRSGEFGFNITSLNNPLPSTDEWAVLPDGTIAFVRGRDYRIEYLNADGTRTSSAKLPFDWQRLMDEDKQRMVDSMKAVQRKSAMTSYVTQMIRWANQYNQSYPADFKAPEGYTLQQGYARDYKLPPGMKFPDKYTFACAEGEEAKETDGKPSCIPQPVMISGGNTPPPPTLREQGVIAASDLPDYKPPFATGAVRADADGNLWIRTIPPKPVPGGGVYDIVSRQGELVDRLQLPPGYALVGFGKGRVVYLSMRDTSGVHLARVRLK
jgi:hypothetical protein